MTDESPGRIARLAKEFHQHLPIASTTSCTPHVADFSPELFQYSTLEALLGGVYDGEVTVGELLTHGDFGLGTFNSLDGEMIILGESATSCDLTAAPGSPPTPSRRRLPR